MVSSTELLGAFFFFHFFFSKPFVQRALKCRKHVHEKKNFADSTTWHFLTWGGTRILWTAFSFSLFFSPRSFMTYLAFSTVKSVMWMHHKIFGCTWCSNYLVKVSIIISKLDLQRLEFHLQHLFAKTAFMAPGLKKLPILDHGSLTSIWGASSQHSLIFP